MLLRTPLRLGVNAGTPRIYVAMSARNLVNMWVRELPSWVEHAGSYQYLPLAKPHFPQGGR